MASDFDPALPTGLVDLDIDYQNLQKNNAQLDISFGVDHLPFSNQSAQNGYHTSVHLNPVSTTATNTPNNYPADNLPATTTGIGQIFSAQSNDGAGTDTNLYFKTGLGNNIQMTTNFLPSLNMGNLKGATFLPGGFILNFGQFNPGGLTTGGPITFKQAFPNNCLGIQMTCSEVGVGNSKTFSPISISKTQFSWNASSAISQIVYWLALGN